MSPGWTKPVWWLRTGLESDWPVQRAGQDSSCFLWQRVAQRPRRGPFDENGGRSRDRTCDLGLVRATLSRLSYPPRSMEDRVTHRNIGPASRKAELGPVRGYTVGTARRPWSGGRG